MSEAFDPRVTPWHIDDSEFYEIESFGDQMRFLVRFAILAPSSHNTQPWEFSVTSEGVEVFADRGRGLPAIDPDERELLMSVGAAITNFRVAAAHFGFDTTVLYESRLEESLPLALISVCETCAPRSDLAQLFNAIRKRHTNREPFDGKPISPQVSSRIRELVDAFPETFRIVFPYEKRRAGELVARADHLQMSRPAFRAELAEWIRPTHGEQSDGIDAGRLGFPSILSAAGAWVMRRFNVGPWLARRDLRLARTASALIVVTAEDDRISLLRAGEALERLLLTITAGGSQYSFLNQPIQVSALRDQVRMLAGSETPAQLLIRIGTARPPNGATPRRDVESVLARSRG